MTTKKAPFLLLLIAAVTCTLPLSADVVETTNGAKIVGKVTSIHDGVVVMSTDYAGEIKVKQVLVTSITTDHAVAVRFADGTGLVGPLSPDGPNKVKVVGSIKTVEVPVGNVAATWAAGQEDPDVVAHRRKWSYELGADINGRSGTQSQLGTSYHLHAALTGPIDTFQYYTAYTRQETDGEVSADQFKIGVDYASNFTPTQSWYVKDEAGFDRVNFIDLYDIAATGLGYDLIKQKDHQVLTVRAGLSYRYDEYAPGEGSTLSEAGADLGMDYMLKTGKYELDDKLSFDPAFNDLGNFIVNHEFQFVVPITKSLWKWSTGVLRPPTTAGRWAASTRWTRSTSRVSSSPGARRPPRPEPGHVP